MEAMILAAGLGTRLRPLTDEIPKALVPVRGRPLLEHVMDRLVAAGATRLVVNTCHHSDQIAAWLKSHTPPGVEIALSHEPGGPWDTGGGFLAAAHLFREDGPIILHAVDVLSRIPLGTLLVEHGAARARLGDKVVATLAVQNRPAGRRLLFDDVGLMGWVSRDAGGREQAARRVREPRGAVRDVAFAGIHVAQPALLRLTERHGTFAIRELYLDVAERGYVIWPADVSAFEWLDVGTPERLREAQARG